MSADIYGIINGNVLLYILCTNFEKYLNLILAETGYVNFTWKALVNNIIRTARIIRIPREAGVLILNMIRNEQMMGWHNHERICRCPEGYMGHTAILRCVNCGS